MADAATSRAPLSIPGLPGLDLGGRNLIFAARFALGAVAALALAFWLELDQPEWAAATACLVAQPTAGAAMAKSAFRMLGTIGGSLVGLAVLAAFSQAPELFVAAMSLSFGAMVWAASRVRNYAAYGVLLAAYTAILVAYGGLSAPEEAWSIAVDRTTEILLGILCSTAATVLVVPVHAGEVLRGRMAETFVRLGDYAASALGPTPPEVFAAKRRQMIGDIVQFDALRSYTAFEGREMRADAASLARVMRSFLGVFAISRALFTRIEQRRPAGLAAVTALLDDALGTAAAALEAVTRKDTVFAPRDVRHDLLAVRRGLDAAAEKVYALGDDIPLDNRANAVLILRRAGDMVHELSMVAVADALAVRGDPGRLKPAAAPGFDRFDALLQGLRAAVGLAIVSLFWMATEWPAGVSAVSGYAVMMFVLVNQDAPRRAAMPYLLGVGWGVAAAFAVMALVLPWLVGFELLAVALAAVLFPAGLLAGTPRYALFGLGFGAFFLAEVVSGNVFAPDPIGYLNDSTGLVAGMAACLVAVTALAPIDPRSLRLRVWRLGVGLLGEAAAGTRHERVLAGEGLDLLAGMLPRLQLDETRDEETLRGLLGTSSMALELGRLRRAAKDPRFAGPAAAALGACLAAIAADAARLTASHADRRAVLADMVAAVAAAHAALTAPAAAGGDPRTRLQALASLRFVADRLAIDGPFLDRSFADR